MTYPSDPGDYGWHTPEPAYAPLYAPAPAAPRPARWRTRTSALLLVAMVGAGATGAGLTTLLGDDSAGGSTIGGAPGSVRQVSTQTAPPVDGTAESAAAKIGPSVVTIRVSGSGSGGSPFGQRQPVSGTGSGVVLNTDGYIVTNNHVVAAAAGGGSITVVFQDGSQAAASIVGRDESYDLAAIKVARTGLRTLDFGDSTSVVVGDEVIAIGAPLGLQGTVTTGIVSALNRPVTAGGGDTAPAFINAIQTDAAINPGNSGGPLVNLRGQVIAVNSAIARVPGTGGLGQSGNIGLGFAIPSAQARRTVEQLIRTGKAQHPVIGVLLDRSYTGQGVKVSSVPQGGQPPVTPDGPADRAGIEPGDVITTFDGRPVTAPDELVVAIRSQAPGDTVKLTVRTSGRSRTVTMVLQASVD